MIWVYKEGGQGGENISLLAQAGGGGRGVILPLHTLSSINDELDKDLRIPISLRNSAPLKTLINAHISLF